MIFYNVYKNGILYMEELKITLDVYINSSTEDNSSVTNINTAIFEKYFIITLYSIWETSTVEAMKEIYSQYPELFKDKKFVFNYLSQVFSDGRTRSKFEKHIDENITYDFNKVVVEFLINNNNLWYKSLLDFFKMYGFDVQCLSTYYSEDEKLRGIIKKLNGLESINVFLESTEEEKYNNKIQSSNDNGILEYEVKGYINYLVDKRNRYGHRYKKAYSNFLNNEFEELYNFFYSLIHLFNQYIDEQLIFKNIGYLTNESAINNQNYIQEIEIDSLNFRKKKKKDELFSVEICFKKKYFLKKDSVLILFNKKKSYTKQICYFSLVSYQSEDDGFMESITSSVMNFDANKCYRLILKDNHYKRTIEVKESDEMKMFNLYDSND